MSPETPVSKARTALETDDEFVAADYEMTAEELADLREAVDAAEEDLRLGRTVPAEVFLAELEAKFKVAS